MDGGGGSGDGGGSDGSGTGDDARRAAPVLLAALHLGPVMGPVGLVMGPVER